MDISLIFLTPRLLFETAHVDGRNSPAHWTPAAVDAGGHPGDGKSASCDAVPRTKASTISGGKSFKPPQAKRKTMRRKVSAAATALIGNASRQL
ncbi:hypothetical protein NXC12_PD00503 (plasmid) [Rhizobium etli]|uniref:Uncharacterized protein n=1 Tax=Rhizobium etli TaxID=29449 RepID=A0AAN1EN20_RHIET|nr:hypothetical protein NXC12_PD00503 [Rhizobium etli]